MNAHETVKKILSKVGKNYKNVFHIRARPTPYRSLKCDNSGGWKPQISEIKYNKITQGYDFFYNETSVVDASSVLNIACVECESCVNSRNNLKYLKIARQVAQELKIAQMIPTIHSLK